MKLNRRVRYRQLSVVGWVEVRKLVLGLNEEVLKVDFIL